MDGHNPCTIYGDGLPSRLSHVKVLPRRVAPPAIVAREIVVGWAEIGRRDRNVRALLAPLRHLCAVADYLEAGSAGSPAVEQRSAQRCVLHTVAIGVQVAVAASSPCNRTKYRP